MKTKIIRYIKNNRKICIIAATAVVLIIVICVYIMIKGNNSKEDSNSETINVENMTKEGEFLKIDIEDCSVRTGCQVQAKVTSSPADYAGLVTWTSTDESILKVDANGLITVVGTGTAAVTATAGNLSDSVVITGFNEETPTNELEFPVNNETVAAGIDVGSNNSKPGQNSNNNSQPGGDGPAKETTASPDGDSNSQKPVQTEPVQTEPQTPPAEYNKLLNSITGFGFEVYNADINTYQYIEGGTYLGEIMISQDSTHIYIKTRTSTFDEAVRNVLKTLIPAQYENVWANYVSTTSDITLKAGNYSVIIVPAKNDDHAQIIINY